MKTLDDFKNVATLTHPQGTTVVHVRSESGDHYLLVFPGNIKQKQLDVLVAQKLDFEDPDCLYVETRLHVPASHTGVAFGS